MFWIQRKRKTNFPICWATKTYCQVFYWHTFCRWRNSNQTPCKPNWIIGKQLSEIDKRIEEFFLKNNSPILTIPGISHFSGTSIISELGEICNYTKASQIIKFAGVAPYHYESSQFTAQHTAITKKGSKYLRKTLYQIILPVISNNEVFHAYYTKKLNEGKGHRCAQGHCIRKLLRVIYHLLSTRQPFNPKLLV